MNSYKNILRAKHVYFIHARNCNGLFKQLGLRNRFSLHYLTKVADATALPNRVIPGLLIDTIKMEAYLDSLS